MNNPRWHVNLGPTWSRFSRPRTDLQLLGTIQNGRQIGPLSKLPDGRYVQVNGDVLSPVNTHKVQAAINAAMHRPARKPAYSPTLQAAGARPAAARAAPVTITYRKRRTVPSDAQAA
jgi:hypothetical protein